MRFCGYYRAQKLAAIFRPTLTFPPKAYKPVYGWGYAHPGQPNAFVQTIKETEAVADRACTPIAWVKRGSEYA